LKQKLTLTGVLPSGYLQRLTRYENKTWYDVPALGLKSAVPSNVQGLSAFAIGKNEVLVWGGEDPIGELPVSVKILSYDTLEWRVVPTPSGPVPLGRKFHASAYDASTRRIFIFGGQGIDSVLYDDTWAYSIDTNVWTRLLFPQAQPGDLPTARSDVAFTQNDRKMYMFGGIAQTGEVFADLWEFDMATLSWKQLITTGTGPNARRQGSMVAVNGTSIAFYGGKLSDRTYSSDLYVLDIESKQWTLQMPSGGPPPAIERSRAIFLDSKRVLFTGGLDGSGAQNATWVWKMHTNQWVVNDQSNAYGSLPGGLHSHALVMFNQSAYSNACQYEPIPSFMLCTPATQPVLLAISGTTNKPSSGLLVSFVNPEPPLPAIAELNVALRSTTTVLCVIGLIIASFFFAFVMLYRDHPVIKASNPRFALMILTGASMALIGMICSTWETSSKRALMVNGYAVAMGYSLMFSALVDKLYMTYVRVLGNEINENC
jgi:hypothetical protein